jgi:tetratricopeptide (TPR) repeat protein
MRYQFKHILLRDAAYNIQLPNRLSNLHRRAAQAIEELHANDLASHYADLAYHYRQAQDAERECKYATLAGQQALQTNAYHKALGFFERVLTLLPAESEKRGSIIAQMGKALTRLGDYAHADKCLTESLALARQFGDNETCAEALNCLGMIAREQGNMAMARLYYTESLAIAQQTSNQANAANALYGLSSVECVQGMYNDAQALMEQCQAVYQAMGDLGGLARAFNGLGNVANMLGEHQAARAFRLKSLRLCRQVGDRWTEATALVNLGETARLQNDYVTARQYYAESLGICKEIGVPFCVELTNLGHITSAQSDYSAAAHYYHEAIRMATSIGAIPLVLENLAGWARIFLHNAQIEKAVELLGFVLHHPAIDADGKLTAEAVLAGLQNQFSLNEIEIALERGKEQRLEDVVAAIRANRPDTN